MQISLTHSYAFTPKHKQKHSEYLTNSLTENSPVSGSSLKKAEIFYGYFDIYSYPK